MRALIFGCTGQDGSYLAEQLAAGGHEVHGAVRGQRTDRRDWLARLVPAIRLHEADLLDQSSLDRVVAEVAPDEVYNLAAVSAPALGWSQPLLMAETTALGALRVLEAVARHAPGGVRLVQAGSLATHGPYGAAKAYAQALAADYRARGVRVSTAVFGGHHSPRRGREFFGRKVTLAAARIALGLQGQLELGPLDRSQDWGWAEDFTRTLPMLARDLEPGDYIVSTGEPHTSREWVEQAFAAAGLDWSEHVKYDPGLAQPTDVPTLTALPDPRLVTAGWTPRRDFAALAGVMVANDLLGEQP